jgi:hypothetical protein
MLKVQPIGGYYNREMQTEINKGCFPVAHSYNPGDPALLILYLDDVSLESKSYTT